MVSDLWRWADPDGQQRKVRFDELRAALAGGLIASNTPVWREGWPNWLPANEVPELTSASVGGQNGVVLNIPPPPLAMLAVQQQYESHSVAPPGPNTTKEPEPPPPPRYTPAAPPTPAALATQIGGSAHLVAAAAAEQRAQQMTAPMAAKPTAATIQSPQAPSMETLIGAPATQISPGLPAVPSRGVPPTMQMTQPLPQTSLPTQMGMPPPPELAAMVAGAKAPKPSKPPPPPMANTLLAHAPPPPPADLSSDLLLESGSEPNVPVANPLDMPPPQVPGGMGMMEMGTGGGVVDDRLAPTEPIMREPYESRISNYGIPRKPGLSIIFDDIAAIRQGKPPRNKLLLGVLGFVALMVLVSLIGIIISVASGGGDKDKDKKDKDKLAASSASASAKTSVVAPPSSVVIPPPPPEEPKGTVLGDCKVSGDNKTIAPKAQIASAIEAHALGTGLALGFAASPRDAVATMLDSSLSPTSTVKTKPAGGDAKRVTPILVNGKLTAMADVDKKGDKISTRRIVASGSLTDVGSADGAIVWAPHGRDSSSKLFTVDGDGAVEALRAIALPDRKGIALAFRKGNAIFAGAAKGESTLDADGELSKIAGLGQVGSPAIAASGDRMIVAWADRASATDDWGLRIAKMKIGSTSTEGTPFAIPEGGLGGQAMSPSIAPLGGGRFLLAWTEGPVSNHQVRALVFGADGLPSGAPLSISAAGVNAGQPAAVVGPDGRGAIAFLAAKGKALEVHATPINCPPR